MRRLGADLPDHLLGGGAQDIGHDGLESVGGCFHWFVSFEEWRRPEKAKPPVGAATGRRASLVGSASGAQGPLWVGRWLRCS